MAGYTLSVMPDAFNPYAPPQTLDRDPDDESEPRLGIFHPRLRPRDAVDIVLGLGIGIPGAIALYGIPLGLIAVLDAPAILVPIAVLSLLLAAILAVLCGIQKITVTPEGLLARRLLLPNVRMTWKDVTHVRELSRSEAFRTAFFAPHRFCSQSLTYRNHFRFETSSTYLVFPPQEVEIFRATIRSLWPERSSPGCREPSPL